MVRALYTDRFSPAEYISTCPVNCVRCGAQYDADDHEGLDFVYVDEAVCCIKICASEQRVENYSSEMRQMVEKHMAILRTDLGKLQHEHAEAHDCTAYAIDDYLGTVDQLSETLLAEKPMPDPDDLRLSFGEYVELSSDCHGAASGAAWEARRALSGVCPDGFMGDLHAQTAARFLRHEATLDAAYARSQGIDPVLGPIFLRSAVNANKEKSRA